LDSGRWFSIRYVYMVSYKDIAKIGVEREREERGGGRLLYYCNFKRTHYYMFQISVRMTINRKE
jgi:hypothetical protein